MDQKRRAATGLRPTPWDGLVILAVVLFAALLFFVLLPHESSDRLTAVVTLDGETVATIDLSQIDPDVTKTLSISDCPYPFTLEYKAGAIRVLESECPGQDCVRTGWIDAAGEQIICLPNKLIVSLVGENSDGPDAISG